jgi:hypothetical protein
MALGNREEIEALYEAYQKALAEAEAIKKKLLAKIYGS